MAEKGGYRHFMLKEIYEQPRAIMDTIRGRVSQESGMRPPGGAGTDEGAAGRTCKKIFIVACGTSWHAALVGKYMIEELACIPTEVDIASEFRYRCPLVAKDNLFIAITQSGETADTLAAMREAKAQGRHGHYHLQRGRIHGEPGGGRRGLYPCGTRDRRGIDQGLHGPAHGALPFRPVLRRASGTRSRAEDLKKRIADLVHIPTLVERCLEEDEAIEQIAKRYFKASDFLYLGRGPNFPVALEGALKLKEISYIHAEGYPAGEMKHGPIALIDENLPVVVLAGKNGVYEKIQANIEEVKARGGIVIALITEGDPGLAKRVDHFISVPATNQLLMPILMSIPLQLLAYHIAVLRGRRRGPAAEPGKKRHRGMIAIFCLELHMHLQHR